MSTVLEKEIDRVVEPYSEAYFGVVITNVERAWRECVEGRQGPLIGGIGLEDQVVVTLGSIQRELEEDEATKRNFQEDLERLRERIEKLKRQIPRFDERLENIEVRMVSFLQY